MCVRGARPRLLGLPVPILEYHSSMPHEACDAPARLRQLRYHKSQLVLCLVSDGRSQHSILERCTL